MFYVLILVYRKYKKDLFCILKEKNQLGLLQTQRSSGEIAVYIVIWKTSFPPKLNRGILLTDRDN